MFLKDNVINEYKEFFNEKEQKTIELIHKVSILFEKFNPNGEIEFGPLMIMDGKRTFSIEDYIEDDFSEIGRILESLHNLPNFIKAKIADILWTEKRDYKSALIAASCYYDYFESNFNRKEWKEPLNTIRRAIYIYAKLNKKDKQNECCQIVYDYLHKYSDDYPDDFPIASIKTLMQYNYGDKNTILEKINQLIVISNKDIYRIEEVYNLKIEYLQKYQDFEQVKLTKKELADYYVYFANILTENNETMLSNDYLEKAIKLYRESGQKDLAEKTFLLKNNIQNKILNELTTICVKVKTPPELLRMIKNMNIIPFNEAITELTRITFFYQKEFMKNNMLNHYRNTFISLISKSLINPEGQKLCTLKPLNLKNPEENNELLKLHIWKYMFDYIEFDGNLTIKPFLNAIRNTYSFTKEDLKFIVYNNPVIPPNREDIVLTGIYNFLSGKYYEALHILAPQTEAIFRYIAHLLGANILTLENDGSSKKKVLSSIFELQELRDDYDNDILFLFEGLMNSEFGGNIRNRIAHGIMETEEASSGLALYFGSAVIKLLSFTSFKCREILSKIENHIN
ncbi:MAG: DUF4209 domain-containing protein [Candidatus Riflebacteria bacterium]|nr:DUF4209 domain-containing protein [Candidatus Riflebacteria bacterium]